MTDTIAFIGGGNMASALIGGLIGNGFAAERLIAVDIVAAQRERLERTFGIKTTHDLAVASRAADTIVLAVKPQHMHAIAHELGPLLAAQLLISVAAGIRSTDLARWLGGYGKIVRVMPNTPALVRAGIAGMYAGPEVTAAQRSRAEAILGAVGEVVWVASDELIDAITAVSGSGPAYVFYFMEAVQRAATELGIEAATARRLVLQTFAGAVQLAQAGGDELAALRERVTSKGGTTECALNLLDSRAVGQHVSAAVHAAMRRAGELGDEFGRAG